MPLDRETRREIEGMKALIRRLESQVRAQAGTARAPQLGHSSIESGALEVRDPATGATRARIGWQPDGTVGMVTEGGNPPPPPSAPLLTPSLGGLRVVWDGRLVDAQGDDVVRPADLAHVDVHVSTTAGFVPSAATRVGTITQAGSGGMLPVVPLPYVEHYVRLVGVTTSGVTGTPGAEASATPLQVDGPDLTAGSVTAGTIAAGAVTADKLEALLVLATRVIAGVPDAARVELDSQGLRGYSDTGEVVFAIDTVGNAVFSGDIVGAEITGSRFSLPTVGGGGIYIEEPAEGWPEILLRSSDLDDDPGIIMSDATLEVRSQVLSPGGPAINSSAYGASAIHTVESDSGPFAARIRTRATETSAHFEIQPPFVGPAGTIYGYEKASGAPAIGYTSPAGGSLPFQSSQIELEGSHDGRAASQATYWADQHIVTRGVNPQDPDGVWALDDTVSFLTNRHAPQTTAWTATQPGFATTGSFVDFTPAEWPEIVFRTSHSGRVRITVQAAGINHHTGNSSLATSFRLSGGSVVPAALSRCAYIRSRGAGVSEPMPATAVFYLQLEGSTDYTLTPTWRISSGSSGTASYYPTLDNSITIEPLT